MVYYAELVFGAIVYLSNSFDTTVVIATLICLDILHLISFLVISGELNTFGESKMAGICITTLASLFNFGRNNWLQLKLISLLGYRVAVLIGILICIAIGFAARSLSLWIDRGQE